MSVHDSELANIKADIIRLDQRMVTEVAKVDHKVDATGARIDKKLDTIEAKFAEWMPRKTANVQSFLVAVASIMTTATIGLIIQIATDNTP